MWNCITSSWQRNNKSLNICFIEFQTERYYIMKFFLKKQQKTNSLLKDSYENILLIVIQFLNYIVWKYVMCT